MRLVITQNSTLDGVIEMSGDWFSPAGNDAETADIRAELQSMMRREQAILLGRVTFESLRSYWPKQTGDTTGITDHLNVVRKYVVTKTLREPSWDNTTLVSDPLLDAVRQLKATAGEDLGVTGSISLCHALIDADLVDEYRLFVYPVVLGRGRRLFRDGLHVDRLALTATRRFESGIALLTYERR